MANIVLTIILLILTVPIIYASIMTLIFELKFQRLAKEYTCEYVKTKSQRYTKFPLIYVKYCSDDFNFTIPAGCRYLSEDEIEDKSNISILAYTKKNGVVVGRFKEFNKTILIENTIIALFCVPLSVLLFALI